MASYYPAMQALRQLLYSQVESEWHKPIDIRATAINKNDLIIFTQIWMFKNIN